jgi:hypothetical protein
MIRYTSAGGYVFSVTMLRGGGQDAAQDSELQQAAASFRVLPAGTVAGTSAPATPQTISARGQAPRALAPASKTKAADKSAPGEEETPAEENSTRRWIWIGGAALVVLIFFFGIIARNPSQKR